jgi:LisH
MANLHPPHPTLKSVPSHGITTECTFFSHPSSHLSLSSSSPQRFNVYIHDYFLKRGFQKAAKEFALEAQIGNDVSPPINARLGFLFEYVFLFTPQPVHPDRHL